ncbi:hypothetical protein M407DRAFT_222140 [Tulasnella calospora MUT 4182]|uniref:Major facilitator superfamily (MFS) profile domain-containing protein n=1 Tax=Tulasnella calospora MUT 4182 TaxID=1051891 RepID=A0A0C3KEG9_9AGAM|nr:hypothetical protein M407DRAFT_222140 [Tulasnella calospora MUT 4182]
MQSSNHPYPPSQTPTVSDAPIQEKPIQGSGEKQWPPQGYGVWNIRIRLMLCLLLPTYLETLDYTVVATAQPHIASNFNKLDLQSWIGTSYVLTSTVFLPIYGSIADILGRHWALQCALVVFLIGSAICTAAQDMPMLLAGRGIAGIGAAGLVSVVRIILSDSGSLNEDNFMNSVLVVLYAIGYSTGPVIGGALLNVSFRWIFAINLPTSLVSAILIFFLLRPLLRPAQASPRLNPGLPTSGISHLPRETPLQKFLRVDFIGTLLFIGGGILVLLALSLGSSVEKRGFQAPIVIVSFTVGFALIFIFVAWEYLISKYIDAACPKWLRLTEPAIPLDIFKSYDICATSFAAMTGGMVLFSAFYFLAIYFSIVQGLSATKSGVQLLYFSPGLGVGVFIALRMIKILKQPKYPAILGGLIIPVAVGLLTTAIDNNKQGQLNGYLLFTGVGIGLTFAPLSLQARFCQPFSRVAAVVSMNLFFRTAGGTIGLAQLSAVLDTKVKSYITSLIVSSNTLTPEQKGEIANLFGGSLNSIQNILSLPDDTRTIVQDAFRHACRWSFLSLIPWCIVSAVLCLFLKTIPQDVVSHPLRPDSDRQGQEIPEPKDVETPASMGGPQLYQQPQPQLYQQPQPQSTVPAREGPAPWKTVPTPRGPITLIIWPIRVGFAYLRASRR